MSCRAYRFQDQMRCSCGLIWDVGDPGRPTCPEPGQDARGIGARGAYGPTIKTPAQKAAAVAPPVLLDAVKAATLAKEYEAAMMEHRAMPYAARQVTAMRQAYRRAKLPP